MSHLHMKSSPATRRALLTEVRNLRHAMLSGNQPQVRKMAFVLQHVAELLEEDVELFEQLLEREAERAA